MERENGKKARYFSMKGRFCILRNINLKLILRGEKIFDSMKMRNSLEELEKWWILLIYATEIPSFSILL